MTSDRWNVPDPKLARIASAEPSPFARLCGHCKHRHPSGERCDYQLSDDVTKCRCRQ